MSLRIERRPPTAPEAMRISEARQRLQLGGLRAAPVIGGCVLGLMLVIGVPGLVFAFIIDSRDAAWWIAGVLGVLLAAELLLIVLWRFRRARLLRSHGRQPPNVAELVEVWHFHAQRAWVLEDDAGTCTAVLDLGDDGHLAMPAPEIAGHGTMVESRMPLHLSGCVLWHGDGQDQYITEVAGSTTLVDIVRYLEPERWTDAERAAHDLHMDCERGYVLRCRLSDLPGVLREHIQGADQKLNGPPQGP